MVSTSPNAWLTPLSRVKSLAAPISVSMKAALNATTSISSSIRSPSVRLTAARAPEYGDVKITTLPPAKRVYGAEAEAAEKKETTHG